MDKALWSQMAMLSGRKMPTRSGSLFSCVRDFLSLTEDQRHSARIVVPGCVQLDHGASTRVLSSTKLLNLAKSLPARVRTPLHRQATKL